MSKRSLLVVADDYGIGPEVSRGILSLMRAGIVTSTVLLVNAPSAAADLHAWTRSGRPGEMGWHPNLNLDGPIARPGDVGSLLDDEGRFASLGRMMGRLLTGRLRYSELVTELNAQLERFRDLVGHAPPMVNGHKHIHVFPKIRQALVEVLTRHNLRPYLRQVLETRHTLRKIRGARLKRLFLTTLGRRCRNNDFPGNATLAGITDPKWVNDPAFFTRWLACVPGDIVELAVHPGHWDETLIGRDCRLGDGQLQRRVAELRLLEAPSFLTACRAAGFTLRTAAALDPLHGRNGYVHVAA